MDFYLNSYICLIIAFILCTMITFAHDIDVCKSFFFWFIICVVFSFAVFTIDDNRGFVVLLVALVVKTYFIIGLNASYSKNKESSK